MKEEMKELDIWLAKNLMGWVDHCNMYWKDPVDGFKRMRKQTTWQPTQDIKQAFECLEKFRELNPDIFISVELPTKNRPLYGCRFGVVVWQSDILELAICGAIREAIKD